MKYSFFALAAAVTFWANVASAGPVYFLVTERAGQATHGDSYVVPLSNPDDIAHARDLISRGPDAAGAPIVVASIAAGADGINLDYLAPDKRAWDWHVTGFSNFADSTVEILDGWPGFVQQDVPGWIHNTNGFVGFWDYTITRELSATPPAAIGLPSALAAAAPVGLLTLILGAWERRRQQRAAN
jgi:hypothetical protein